MLDRDRLRMARLERRLSQGMLGKAMGKDQSYVSKLERGELQDITIQTLVQLAEALHVSADYLLGRTAAPAHPPKRPRPRTTQPVG